MRPLSEDLRKRIIDKREAGYGPTDISDLFGVSRRAIYRLYERYDRTGSLKAMRPGRRCGSKLDAYQTSRYLTKRSAATRSGDHRLLGRSF